MSGGRGFGGLTPLIKDDPLTGDCKVWSWVGFDSLRKVPRFHVSIRVNRQEYCVITYFSLHLIANKISIRKCTRMHYFEMKKNQKNFQGRGHQPPSPHPSPSAPSALDYHCFFDKSHTDVQTCNVARTTNSFPLQREPGRKSRDLKKSYERASSWNDH